MKTSIILLYFSLILLIFGMISCTPYKRIKYLQSKNTNTSDSVYENKFASNYIVQPNDLLYIKIIGMDDKTALFFNTNIHSQNYESIKVRLYFESYLVNDSGNISIPVLGPIKVAGYTIPEISKIIDTEIKKYLISGTAIVRLSNNQITILGEVQRPGIFDVYIDKINFFQALGMAGDMTNNADIKKIMVIRNRSNDTKTTHYIDITDRKFLASEFMFLLPGDIIYVEPVRAKQFATNPFSIQNIISTVTTLLLLYSVLK